MTATRLGGIKAAQKNKELYGEDFYKRIGAKGGSKSRGGGFAKDIERAKRAGAKGGSVTKEQRLERIRKREERDNLQRV